MGNKLTFRKYTDKTLYFTSGDVAEEVGSGPADSVREGLFMGGDYDQHEADRTGIEP